MSSTSGTLEYVNDYFWWNLSNDFQLNFNDKIYSAKSKFSLQYSNFRSAELGFINVPTSVIWNFSLYENQKTSNFYSNVQTLISTIVTRLSAYSPSCNK